ncbi:MAG: tyrosine-type recombinase/integrase [Candidatus Sifarchaeia archaeon]
MHTAYERILNQYLVTHTKSWCNVIACFLKKLPAPDEIEQDWVLGFLSKYDNPNTKDFYFKALKVVLRKIDRLDALEGITFKNRKTKLKPSELLSPTEVSQMLTACRDSTERAMIEFFLESGCRAGEMLGLELEDIQLQERFIMVNVRGKTGTRTLPLLRDNLESFLNHLTYVESGQVFSITYKVLYRLIKALYERAGVRKRKRATHIFRHMKATQLLELGVPETIIKQFMGWSLNSTIINNYVHLTTKRIQDFFARLYGLESREHPDVLM